jgi:hypothetical protein
LRRVRVEAVALDDPNPFATPIRRYACHRILLR